MPVVLCLVIAFLIVKTWNDGQTDQELARKGIVSPRLQAKYGDGARVKTRRYGLVDYLADAWSDNWRNRTEIRRVAVNAAAEVKPSNPGDVKPSWRDRLAAAKAAVVNFGKKVAQPVEATPKPTTPPPSHPEDVADDDVDRTRTCPTCGARLTRQGRGWWHPDGPDCPQQPPVDSTPADTKPTEATGPAPRQDAGEDPAVCARCGRPLHGRWSRSIGSSPVCRYGCHSAEQPPPRGCRCPICRPDEPEPNSPDSNGGKSMTAPTGEAVNYETSVAELEALIREKQAWLDSITAVLSDLENAKNHLSDGQGHHRVVAQAIPTMLDFLTSKSLDPTTLGLIGAAKEAMPASAVDVMLALIEEAEAKAREMHADAATALEAAQAALAHIQATYSSAEDTVQTQLGGDSSFLGGGNGGGGAGPEWQQQHQVAAAPRASAAA